MFSMATSGSWPPGGIAAIAEHLRARSAMTIAEPSEHEICGLGTEGEYRLARFEGRPQLREREPDGGRSSVSQPIRRDDDPLRRDAERRRQDGVHAAIGLMRKDVVARLACRTLRRRGAMQKQFEARATDHGEIVPELGKSKTAARGVAPARSKPCANTRALAKPVQAWRNSTKGPS